MIVKTLTLRWLFVLMMLITATSMLEASKRIVVDLSQQIAIAYQDGRVLFYGRISSGKPGRETPTGSYHVREKDIDHVSNLWPQPNGGAKMRYMLRITRDGVAMHLGVTPDYPASHGCIRMKDGFAQKMYAWAEKWIKVDIIGNGPKHSPAVALPAYARSSRILRQSVGGGTRGPMAVMSSNPKDHAPLPSSLVVPADSMGQSLPRKTHVRKHHYTPLETFSSNPKIKKSTQKPTRKKRRKKRKNKHRSRHPDPLKAVS